MVSIFSLQYHRAINIQRPSGLEGTNIEGEGHRWGPDGVGRQQVRLGGWEGGGEGPGHDDGQTVWKLYIHGNFS